MSSATAPRLEATMNKALEILIVDPSKLERLLKAGEKAIARLNAVATELDKVLKPGPQLQAYECKVAAETLRHSIAVAKGEE
jgi:hypothetical protein